MDINLNAAILAVSEKVLLCPQRHSGIVWVVNNNTQSTAITYQS